jgi:uncharacterized NAD(P)/FAD-binding protein YdhS
MQAVKESGQLEVLAGRLQKTEIKENLLEVTIRERATENLRTLHVQRLINCTGPQCNYAKVNSPLVQSLLKNHIISPDALNLGINASPEGKVTEENGKPSNSVFTIGPALRGALWESTAVPEISEQAAHLAQTILQSFCPSINSEISGPQTEK